jgi:hypothetical protein
VTAASLSGRSESIGTQHITLPAAP